MGANSAELNLDLSSVYVPRTIAEFLTQVSVIADVSEKSLKLNDYVKILEDELRKIHAFKHELPLCMLLLNDAIRRLKEETMQCVRSEAQPATEGFVRLEGNSAKTGGAKTSSDFSDKKSWMSSAQLWSTSTVTCENNSLDIKKQVSALDLKLRDRVEDASATENPFQICNFSNRGGAFVPFNGHSGLRTKEDKEVSLIPGLSLSSPAGEMGSIDLNLEGNNGSTGSGSSTVTDQMKPQSKPKQQQQLKKQRRCWSPELHRRFVDALQQLGGPQIATPKHIRDLMQADGLTNDEVKSHLQKYRIHLQKLPASSTATSTGS